MRTTALCLGFLTLALGTAVADDVALQSNTTMRADRSLVSLKAGTVVEVLDRNDKTISIRYKGQTGTIPASSLTAAKPETSVAASAPAPAAAAKPAAPAKPAGPASGSLVVDQPQSVYGNLVKKAEANIAKHDENLVKPANAATDDTPSK
jgi:hypothetical protein